MSNDTYYSRYARLRKQLERANAMWSLELERPFRQGDAFRMAVCNRVIADIERQIDRLQEQAEEEDTA